MAAVRTSDNFSAKIRLHRNVVFVVERLSWWDNTLQLTSQPVSPSSSGFRVCLLVEFYGSCVSCCSVRLGLCSVLHISDVLCLTHYFVKQVDALLQTDFGSWAMRKCKPLFASVAVLIGPISASCQIAITTARIAAKTAVHGALTMAKESFS